MKLRLNLLYFILLMVLVSLPSFLTAQLSKGGIPSSYSMSLTRDADIYITADPPSMDRLFAEDQESPLPYPML